MGSDNSVQAGPASIPEERSHIPFPAIPAFIGSSPVQKNNASVGKLQECGIALADIKEGHHQDVRMRPCRSPDQGNKDQEGGESN
jgi:hypothetical protein